MSISHFTNAVAGLLEPFLSMVKAPDKKAHALHSAASDVSALCNFWHHCNHTDSRSSNDKLSEWFLNHLETVGIDPLDDATYRQFGLNGLADFILLEKGPDYLITWSNLQESLTSLETRQPGPDDERFLRLSLSRLLGKLEFFTSPSLWVYHLASQAQKIPDSIQAYSDSIMPIRDEFKDGQPITLSQLTGAIKKTQLVVQGAIQDVHAVRARYMTYEATQRRAFGLA